MKYEPVQRADGSVMAGPQDLREGDIWPMEWFEPDHRAEIERVANGPVCPPQYRKVAGGALIPDRAWREWQIVNGRDFDNKRRSIPGWMRREVMRRDGRRCGICLTTISDADDVHLDHIHPVAKGGKNTPDNLQVAHATCNMKKGARVL